MTPDYLHDALLPIAYLIAGVLFMFGIKSLASPNTARRGNQVAAVGMLIAIVAALLEANILNPVEVFAGMLVGSALGYWMAVRVQMTQMPEMVAAFNGFGGLASLLVASSDYIKTHEDVVLRQHAAVAGAMPDFSGLPVGPDGTPSLSYLVSIILTVIIGAVTFTGSFVAFGKLNGSYNYGSFPGLRLLSFVLGAATIAGAIAIGVFNADYIANPWPVWYVLAGLAIVTLVLGVFLVQPIGGADMPVVIALLNSYSGLAAAASGFVLGNYGLIIAGALVGASGIILTKIMCDAMNRSLANVLLGGFGEAAAVKQEAQKGEAKPIKATSADDAAIQMSYAQKVIVVPGYGLAVSQAQHEVREMAELLQKEGVEVKYAIHPVAGRMPGHMNVLLAEANVPYDQLYDMEDINSDFSTTDVVLVVGANDVVNPAARTNPQSPIYGMPILNVDEAQSIIVLKRSMRSGYAGIENDLFHNPKTNMLFGDAKDSLGKVVKELKALKN